MQPSEAAEIIINEIYPQLYFLLPRLPAKSSSTKLNERLFSILLLLEMNSKAGKNLTIGEIGEISKLSPSDTTRKIKDLEKRGFVRKATLNFDDRSKEVFFTNQGYKVLSAEKEKRKQWFEKILETLEENERNSFIKILLKVSNQTKKFFNNKKGREKKKIDQD
jgi:DNA-binding MarR family transcriptional regulator